MVLFGREAMYCVGKKAAGRLLDGVEQEQQTQPDAEP